jgi:site-specific DNA recombinase
MYLGHLVQGKTQTIDVTIKKRADISKNKWSVHKNNHEAIISEETFQLAQAERKRRTDYHNQWNSVRHSTKHLFSNLVKCKLCDCSCNPRRARYRSPAICYSCNEYDLFGLKVCGHKRNAINEKDLIRIIKSELEALAENDYRAVKLHYHKKNADKRRESSKLDIATLEIQLAEQKKRGDALLDLLTEGIIGKEQFKLQNEPIAEQINLLTIRKEELLYEKKKLTSNGEEEGETVKSIRRLLEIDVSEWTNGDMRKIINKIYVDKISNTVEIYYNFAVLGN